MVKVVVLGAGIIATATAYRLLEARPDIQLTIISKEFSPNTTSDGAAGYWSPYIAVGTPEETIWYLFSINSTLTLLICFKCRIFT